MNWGLNPPDAQTIPTLPSYRKSGLALTAGHKKLFTGSSSNGHSPQRTTTNTNLLHMAARRLDQHKTIKSKITSLLNKSIECSAMFDNYLGRKSGTIADHYPRALPCITNIQYQQHSLVRPCCSQHWQ